MQFHTKADVRLGGAPVPGAGVEASDNTTFGIEIGYDLLVLASKDGVVMSLDAKSAFGSVLQTGAEVPIDASWGLFVDVKKIFLKPAPAASSARPPRQATRGSTRC